MNPEWLCYVNGQEYGPYTWPQLVQMAQAGNVVPQTHVRRNFDSQWYLAEQVPGLFGASTSPATSPATKTAITNPKAAPHPATPTARPATGSGSKKALSKSGPQPVEKAAAQAAPVADANVQVQAPVAAAPVVVGSLPKGRVKTNTSTAISPAATRPIPVQTSTTIAGVAPLGAFAAKSADDEPITPVRKSDSARQMVLYLGGAMVGVALLGGVAMIWKFTRPPEEPKEVAAAPVVVPTSESDPKIVAEEANPNDEAIAGKSSVAKGGGKPGMKTVAAKAITPEPPASPSTTLVKSVKAWKPIEKFGSVRVGNGLSCNKLSAYLAADATGRKVAVRTTGGATLAAAPADNATAASVAPGTEGAANGETPAIIAPSPAPAGEVKYVAAEAAPFLFVEISIINKDTKPLTYAGWNQGDTAAVLVDAAGKPFKLLPATATPNAARKGAVEIKPGESIQDVLAFEVPPNADLQFRLALPQTAFSSKLKGAWGYEIGGGYLAASSQVVVGADGVPVTAPPVRRTLGIPIPGIHEEPMPQPAPAQAVPAPAQATPAPPAAGEAAPAEPEMKKPLPMEKIPIPGLTDAPDTKPMPAKSPDEVPNLMPPPAKKK